MKTSTSTEEWRPIPTSFLASIGVAGGSWEASSEGRVRSEQGVVEPTELDLRLPWGGGGVQPAIELAPGVKVVLCRLVAHAWVPNPFGSTSVRRHDRDPWNNRPENLYWKVQNQRTPWVAPQGLWAPILWAPGYEVSSEGGVRKDGKDIRPLIRRGEPTVFLYGSGGKVYGRKVAELVGQTFLPRPMGHARISRVEGSDPRSCRVADLRWVAAGGHGGRSGLPRRAKLTRDQALEIRRRAAAGELQAELSAEFGVTQAAVSQIVTRRTWR